MRKYYITVIIAGIVLFLGLTAFVVMTGDQTGYEGMRTRLIVLLAGVCALFVCIAICYGIYINRRFIAPLRKIRSVSEDILAGNLDSAPEPDGKKDYGIFSDSFDIMRTEFVRARKREIALRKKETELLSALCEDIKSPLKGIELTTELMRTKFLVDKNEKDAGYMLDKIDSISKKAEQIDDIVNDRVSAALDDLGEIKVNCSDTESRILEDIVKKHDEKGKVNMSTIPGVLIHIDNRRMSQVIGNIIANSYKYANTSINIGFLLMDDYLQMKISDYGPGVPADEIGHITEKFYRGRMWTESGDEGAGLGLYIADTLMEMMGGKLLAENTGEGLCVTLLIRLSGVYTAG